MGSDKARLELGGRSLLEKAVQRVEQLGLRAVLTCGRERRYEELGRELVLDAEVGPRGPVAGILGALETLDAELFLVLACDLPRDGSERGIVEITAE